MGWLRGCLSLVTTSGHGIGLPVMAAVYVPLLAIATILQRHFALTYRSTVASSTGRRVQRDRLPSVDVVVPCFNEEPALLEQCLRSLANQRYSGELQV